MNQTSKMKESAAALLSFIQNSPSCFHVVDNTANMLLDGGYHRLRENQKWELKKGGKYFVTRNDSSLIAFQVPTESWSGFQLISSHTDSPCFKIKEKPELVMDGTYTRLNVEKYGGMLLAPWFDRPLSVAGRILVRDGEKICQKLVNLDRDLLMIPNVAIHMRMEINEGYKYKVQQDLCPLFADGDGRNTFLKLVAESAGVQPEDILGTDLFLYNRQQGTFLGACEEFIGSPKLDDLQCMFASLRGFMRAENSKAMPMFCAFDNEEVGSLSRQGASSTFLRDTMTRICSALGKNEDEYRQLLAQSFMISADNAHAVHPNHPEKADQINRPKMNEGIVIKFSANQKYTSDGRSSAVFKLLCERAGVPCQIFANHSDILGGSTLGNLSNQSVSLYTVDIGLPQLAMHSPFEMAGSKDSWYLEQAAEVFYRSRLLVDEEENIMLVSE